MFDFFENITPSIFVVMGAAPGALCRMKISNKFFSNSKSNLPAILLVNTIGLFLLGYFIGINNKITSISETHPLYLLVCVGFLGSFSTFSSLILEFYYYFVRRQWKNFFLGVFSSILLGICFASIGYSIGNA